MSKFKVGDRVRVTDELHQLAGHTGEVVEVGAGGCYVRLDQGQHRAPTPALENQAASGVLQHGWWVYDPRLLLTAMRAPAGIVHTSMADAEAVTAASPDGPSSPREASTTGALSTPWPRYPAGTRVRLKGGGEGTTRDCLWPGNPTYVCVARDVDRNAAPGVFTGSCEHGHWVSDAGDLVPLVDGSANTVSSPREFAAMSSRVITRAEDHDLCAPNEAYLARAVFEERIAGEARRIAESASAERIKAVMGVMWERTRPRERAESEAYAAKVLERMRCAE